MKKMPCIALGLGLLLTAAPACKQEHASAGAALSPDEPGAAVSTPSDEDERYANRRLQGAKEEVIREQDEAIQVLGEVKWEEDEPDAGGAKSADVEAEEKARLAREKKEAQDLADTENAINAALQGLMPQIRACYSAEVTGETTLSIRVHRLGYVLNSKLKGSSTSTSTCVQKVLSKMRVTDVKTDTLTVERTFRFKKR